MVEVVEARTVAGAVEDTGEKEKPSNAPHRLMLKSAQAESAGRSQTMPYCEDESV